MMSFMVDSSFPAPSAESIREAFLADAEAGTKLVLRVSEALSAFEDLRPQIESAHGAYAEAYAEAERSPIVAAKLAELKLPNPEGLSVALGRAARRPKAAGSRSKSRATSVAHGGGPNGAGPNAHGEASAPVDASSAPEGGTH